MVQSRARMKVLVIGSGGREHALVWKLAESARITGMWCAPGNAGTSEEHLKSGKAVQNVDIGAEDLDRLAEFAQGQGIELTVVGPDNPLAMGIVDLFQRKGLRIWGPNKKAAQFEGSKAFSQAFMEKHGIPTARSGIFRDAMKALEFAGTLQGKCAVKADGLALGKGVMICRSMSEAEEAIEEVLVKKSFGAAGNQVVIQELLEGIEVSLHAICDGKTAKLFPTSQDHKRIFENDQGPNTGGMGTYSPAPFVSAEQMRVIEQEVLGRWLQGCVAEGIDYRGILYPGLMMTANGPKVLEFNARFGDPETQVYLPRLGNDLLEVIEASVDGKLRAMELNWKPQAAVCVVMASEGYPASSRKGVVIEGIERANALAGVKVFHAGTALKDGKVVTNGGRVLGVTALGDTLAEAREVAYKAVAEIRFQGAQFRRDIAAKALQC